MEEQNNVVEEVKVSEEKKGFRLSGSAIALLSLVVVVAGVSFLKKPVKAPEITAPESLEVTQIDAGGFYYKPNILKVKKGEKVKIEIKAVDMMHDFNIDELGIKSPIVQSGESAIVEFVADKVGEFEYYCSVGQHRNLGQVGKLIVEE